MTEEEMKNQVMKWFKEWISAPAEFEEDPVIEPEDATGLVAVANFLDTSGDFVRRLDDVLDDFNYMVDLSTAYDILAEMLEWILESGIITTELDDWQSILDYFIKRSNEFAGQGDKWYVGDVSEEAIDWTGTLDSLVRHVCYGVEDKSEDGEFTVADKMYVIKRIFDSLISRGVVTRKHPWVKAMLTSLDDDWRTFGGGFHGSPGTGSVPWSYGQ